MRPIGEDGAGAVTPATLFGRARLYQSWLDVEAALALTQSRLGMIPDWAGEEIAKAARLERIGLEALEVDAARTLAPILSLTRLLAEAAGPAGDYVHWGATTQNVTQTGRILILRDAHRSIMADIARSLDLFGEMAERHAETFMAGRTNRRHALPVSFGFKVAGWIEELVRAADRLEQAAERGFALPFGGAVGAMHAFGGHGRALNEALAGALGLRCLIVPGRAVNDLIAEYILELAMFGMSAERIAGELYRLMTEEIGEIEEVLEEGAVGSSTMPQKVNPKHVVRLLGQTAELRGVAGTALEAGLSKHEGDAVANHVLSSVIERAVPLAWQVAGGLADLAGRVRPVPARMAGNLGLTEGGIVTEGLMMQLALKVGRGRAHDIIHHALEHGRAAGLATSEALSSATELTEHFGADRIAEMLDPVSYTGDSAAIARQGAEFGRAAASRLRSRGL